MVQLDQSRVRLLEMATIFAIGGTEKQLVELANGLDEKRFELQLACMHRQGPLLAQLKDKRPPAEFQINSLYGAQTMRQQLRFANHLGTNRIEVFHAQGFYPNVFGIPAARLARTPVVIGSVRDLGDKRSRLQQLVQKWACALADAVVVNGAVVKRQLISEGWSEKKIHVIHNGVDLSRFTGAARSQEARVKLGLPVDGALVVTVSRMGRAKGIEQFIDAAALLAALEVNARFVIVGDAEPGESGKIYRAELEARAAALGLGERLFFAGFRLDVAQILEQADIAVIPSLSEATSNSLLESMAAGAAVVATEVGGNPDVVKEGVNGALVPPSNPALLARAIKRFLDSPAEAQRLGDAGRKFVQQNFSVAQMVRNTERLYLSLLEKRARNRRAGVGSTP